MKRNRLYVQYGAGLLLMLLFFGCSPASKGKSAGREYCECDKEDGILNVAKCKKNVLKDHEEEFKNKEFETAFWETVEEWDE